jgi:hypothetical protein
MKTTVLRIMAISMTSILLPSCNQNSGISDQQISDQIKTQIPPYLSVNNVALEKMFSGSQGEIGLQTYNFKVSAASREPLFVEEQFDSAPKQDLISKGLTERKSDGGVFSVKTYDFKGTDQIHYLKQVNPPSDPISIYGSVTARKIVDKVEFGGFSIASGLQNLGKPKGSFPPDSLIVRSPAYEEALSAIVKSQKEEVAKEQASEEAKRASEARLLAAQQAELAKKKNELLTATTPGTRYRGAWFAGSSSKIIELEFIDQQMDGRILRAKFTLPDDPTQVIEYEGYLVADNAKSDSAGPIRLHFVRGTAKRADWGIDWSNLFGQSAEFDFNVVGDRLIHRTDNLALLQIELSKTEPASPNANPAQDEINAIRARTSEMLERLRDPKTSQEERKTLREEASKLADRLDILLGKKGP